MREKRKSLERKSKKGKSKSLTKRERLNSVGGLGQRGRREIQKPERMSKLGQRKNRRQILKRDIVKAKSQQEPKRESMEWEQEKKIDKSTHKNPDKKNE